ncbi:MAG: hypothetical protein IJY04_10260, partial [Clostridia bacterium]|nr:hypothetical protein [Clostridia bacterium]
LWFSFVYHTGALFVSNYGLSNCLRGIISLPQRGRWIVEDETDEEVTNPQIARLLKTFSEGFDSSKK